SMSTQERKKREKEQRRNTIIDAAEQVIFSKGVEEATMAEIAQKAGLSKGTLYLYFKNKIDLCIAICERGSNILKDRFNTIFAEEHSGLELVRLMGEAYLGFVDEYPNYFNMFIFYEQQQHAGGIEETPWGETCRKNMKEAVNLMVYALQIGMQDGSVDDSYDPKELAILIWASTRGITHFNYLNRIGG